MYCNFCNSQLPEGVSVCAVCGHDNTPAPAYAQPQQQSYEAAPQSASYAYEAPAAPAAPAAKTPAKQAEPLSSAVSALVWGCLSAIMSFGGLFLAMSFEGALFGLIMAIVSKLKAKAAKAYPGTTAAAIAKGAGAASTFGLIASIYVMVTFIVTIALIFFIYFLYFALIFFVIWAESGMVY